jgi:tetratricopeptide (TPR) repeat protein
MNKSQKLKLKLKTKLNDKLPNMCLNMIVKDEAHIIQETLNSVYKYINYYVISDTGSTDDTKNIIKSFFDSKNIQGEIFNDKWKNFGHNRSLAFAHAKGKSKYIWVIDADDVLEEDTPNSFNVLNLTEDCYNVRITRNESRSFTYMRRQIFKNFSDFSWKYVGVLHEYPDCDKPGYTLGELEGDYYIHARCMGNRSKDPKKYLNDALMIEEAIKEEPNNTRYMFYLAQSYGDYGDLETSIERYKKRITMGGYAEEVYYSLYKIGFNLEHLVLRENKEQEQEKTYKWAEAEEYYLKAFAHSPHRLEPLFNISVFYNKQKNYERAYYFSSRGIKIPFPTESQLFISNSIYEYLMLEEHAFNCYKLNKLKEAYVTYKRIIEEDKYEDYAENRLKQNLDLCKHELEQVFKKENKEVNKDVRYTYFPDLDSHGGDVFYYKNKTLDSLKDICDLNSEAIAFNHIGYVKSKIVEESKFRKLGDRLALCGGLYVKTEYLEKLKTEVKEEVKVETKVDELKVEVVKVEDIKEPILEVVRAETKVEVVKAETKVEVTQVDVTLVEPILEVVRAETKVEVVKVEDIKEPILEVVRAETKVESIKAETKE